MVDRFTEQARRVEVDLEVLRQAILATPWEAGS
jgi:hypothetical protein